MLSHIYIHHTYPIYIPYISHKNHVSSTPGHVCPKVPPGRCPQRLGASLGGAGGPRGSAATTTGGCRCAPLAEGGGGTDLALVVLMIHGFYGIFMGYVWDIYILWDIYIYTYGIHMGYIWDIVYRHY